MNCKNLPALMLALCGMSLHATLPARAQAIASPFDEDYTIVDLGEIPGLPFSYGGVTFQPGNPNTLLIGAGSNDEEGQLYAVGLARDASGRITGFKGSAKRVADAPFNDGGLAIGPDNVLFYTRWPDNEIGQIKPGSKTTDKVVSLDALGVMESLGGLNFVPPDFPGAGQLKAVGYDDGAWYTLGFSPDGMGTFTIDSATMVTTLAEGSENFVFVGPNAAQFAVPSILIAEYNDSRLAAYELDEDGNPIVESRRLFASSLPFPLGAAFDPLTGDLVISSHFDLLFVVRGFPGTHDLAVIQLKAAKRVTLQEGKAPKPAKITAAIQNLSVHTETIENLETLENLVRLDIESLGDQHCEPPVANLVPPKSFPVALPPGKKLKLTWLVTMDCANDELASTKTEDHSDYRFTVTVDHSALDGEVDTTPDNDACPRPPNPATGDKGCGNKDPLTKQIGADVLTDVVVK